MQIRITKRADGGAVLKCVRDDGTEDWQKQQGASAAFFPLHDLTHYSVETELGIRDAFYGLVAQGWSIDDTTGKGTRGAIPPVAIFVETVVGLFDSERASSARWTAEEFNDNIARHLTRAGGEPSRLLTDDELLRIRKRRAELFDRWYSLPAGATLELPF
jgi:hypothetical protein